MFFMLCLCQFFGRAGRKSRRAIRYKSSQSFANATLCCGLFATIPHAIAVNPRLICKYSLLDLTSFKKLLKQVLEKHHFTSSPYLLQKK